MTPGATSILSFKERGPWGDPRYRGNASGHVYRTLFELYRPKVFVDPTAGSGTAVEVAREMGIEAYGLDLKDGFDALAETILKAVGKPADMVFSHPPYWTIIRYSGAVWGKTPHPNDLSQIEDYDEFMDRLHALLLNQREATHPGGTYGLLIGDIRKQGRYYSPQADLIARLPREELRAVLIKVQHNVQSNQKSYPLKHPRIMHEYLLLWERSPGGLYITLAAGKQLRRALEGTWRAVIHTALVKLGGRASLRELYEAVAAEAPERIRKNPNWQAKIRQVLQRHFNPIERGVWSLPQTA